MKTASVAAARKADHPAHRLPFSAAFSTLRIELELYSASLLPVFAAAWTVGLLPAVMLALIDKLRILFRSAT